MATIKDLKRMCLSIKFGCATCPLGMFAGPCYPDFYPDNIDEIVDDWVEKHPVKTYAMDFFEKFPNAQRKATTGIPNPCIRVIYSEFYDKDCPVGGCSECWNQEFTVSEKVQKSIQEYSENNNPILLFFKEDVKIENEPTNAIYSKYKDFCISNNFTPISNIEFSKQVKKHFGVGIKNKSINGKKYRIFTKG